MTVDSTTISVMSQGGTFVYSSSMPYERLPAPGRLGVLEAFLRSRKDVVDARSLAAWLFRNNLIAAPTAISDLDYRRAIELREAFRDLAWHNNGGPPAPGAASTIQNVARRAAITPIIHADGTLDLRSTATGIDGALGTLVEIGMASMLDGAWARVKACAADDCRYVFYDHTRNHAGRWCEVAACGDIARMRAHRARRARR